ncbi:GrBNV gp97-like protein-like protein [Mauternbach virus]|uniref:GrBNV gp97-like protein-like protein n=1 Tax=Mauternbach virus TaxID=2486603 RepID=A0A3G3E7K0_9VIRU|nr:GrBNV gp97-like protein-like protein [Mauternbach virus]AYP97960.1 GrBNV gp97-like protein-like protein [Mauternbach virus]
MSDNFYFDESIFTTGESFLPFSHVNVYNRADAYLVEKVKLQVGFDDECVYNELKSKNVNMLEMSANLTKMNDKQTNKLDTLSINLNPRKPCRGINVYSFNLANNRIEKTINFNQVYVSDGISNNPITIADYVPETIYTVGELTPFESAIMIKYYAINNADVSITRHLYNTIEQYFDNVREWFNYKPIGVIQNSNGELLYKNEIINVPNITISDEEMGIY